MEITLIMSTHISSLTVFLCYSGYYNHQFFLSTIVLWCIKSRQVIPGHAILVRSAFIHLIPISTFTVNF